MKINQTIIKDQKRIVNNITGAELQALAKGLTVFEGLFEYNNGNAYVDITTALAYVLGYKQGLLEAYEISEAIVQEQPHQRKYPLNKRLGNERIGEILEIYKNNKDEIITTFVNSHGFVTEYALAKDERIGKDGKIHTPETRKQIGGDVI